MSSTTKGLAGVRDGAGEAEMPDYSDLLGDLRANFRAGRTRELAWRKEQLHKVKTMMLENKEAITEAVRADHGGPKFRGMIEIACVEEVNHALANVAEWMKPVHVKTKGAKAEIRMEPKGVILLIAPWNYPISLVMAPLAAMIAAGNCVVIKPSEVSPNSAECIRQLVTKYMDPGCVRVVLGGVPETKGLLKQRWDHILYTGNGAIGREVMRAAAEHLTPVTLELGGKSPVIIDETASVKEAVKRITMGKWLNCGQTCIAPDYVVVHRDQAEAVIQGLAGAVKQMFAKGSSDYGRVISERHVHRLLHLLRTTKGKVVTGGADQVDVKKRFVPPTIIVSPSLADPVMQEEIFGPILPIIPVSSTSDALKVISEVCATPLALYMFSEDKEAVQHVLDRTRSGGVSINTTIDHYNTPLLPFGGIGESGIGAYHGRYGFEEFTHRRAVLINETKKKPKL
eukprot:Sspe_Gene.35307::Locus_17115_Transcript_1_1_Confidence_1.000_Length_1573::g.35307::m.35307/K00128/ALDH; aldehyde dehydrogenase (NAD+)